MSTNTPIATQTLTSSASSVTFSSIPQGYTDLVVIISGKTSTDTGLPIQFNSDTSSNYSGTLIYGSGSSAVSERNSNQTSMNSMGRMDSISGNGIFNIMNYSNTTTYKTVLSRGNNANSILVANVGLWRSTSAINTIKFMVEGAATYSSGTTFSIYGIQTGNKDQKATGGNIVTTDGTYMYHTFTSSGSFIPNQSLTADYLVVGGGGSGGYSGANPNGGGGGGAGGMRSTVTGTGGSGSLETALTLSLNTNYTVTVGAGGVGGVVVANGNNSVFATITSTGGGSGADWISPNITQNGNAGGSGGGATGGSGASPYGTGGSATPSGQGFAGGSAGGGGQASGGGGGGASAVGTNGSGGAGGSGGNGRATSISGSSVTYAGGGASTGTTSSGTAGTGGGGTVGSAGTANTGGGGGGSSTGNSGNGGSGIVIIRYLL